MKPERRTELLVGIFIFVGMAMLGGIILQLGGVREYFRDKYHLRIAFPNAAGLRGNSPVYLSGSKIGKLSAHPTLNDSFTGVILDVEIYEDVDIPADAVWVVGTAGLMGDALLEVKPTGNATRQFIPHDYDQIIQGKVGGLSDLQNTAEQVSKKVDVVLDDVRSALADLKEALTKVNKDALAPESVKHFRDSMRHLDSMMARVDERFVSEENADSLTAAIRDIKEAAASFKASANNVETQSERLDGMFDKLEPAVAKADRFIDNANSTLSSIKTAADNFSTTAQTITNSKGLLGGLMHDEDLKTEFSDLISNLKRSGIVFYRNVADKERTQEDSPPQSPAQRKPPPIFRR